MPKVIKVSFLIPADDGDQWPAIDDAEAWSRLLHPITKSYASPLYGMDSYGNDYTVEEAEI